MHCGKRVEDNDTINGRVELMTSVLWRAFAKRHELPRFIRKSIVPSSFIIQGLTFIASDKFISG